MQFIIFQRREACSEMEGDLSLLGEREAGARNKGRLSHRQQHNDESQRNQRGCRDAPLCCWSTTPRRDHLSLHERPCLLMGPHQTRAGIQPFWLDCVCSAIITALQSSTISSGTCYTLRGCTLRWRHQLSLAKVGQRRSTQGGAWKINEDIAQVNQPTKHA